MLISGSVFAGLPLIFIWDTSEEGKMEEAVAATHFQDMQ